MAIAQPKTYQRDWKAKSAALLMLVAGIIHFIIIPHHWEHAPAHGIAMGVTGVLEVIWAIAYWLRPSRILAQIGVILAVSMIALWAITRIAPAPFTNEAEEVDFSGVFTKVLEAISAAVLLAIVVKVAPAVGAGWAARRAVITVLLISVLLAVGIYEVARAAQPLFPQLSPPAMNHMDDHQ